MSEDEALNLLQTYMYNIFDPYTNSPTYKISVKAAIDTLINSYRNAQNFINIYQYNYIKRNKIEEVLNLYINKLNDEQDKNTIELLKTIKQDLLNNK